MVKEGTRTTSLWSPAAEGWRRVHNERAYPEACQTGTEAEVGIKLTCSSTAKRGLVRPRTTESQLVSASRRTGQIGA